MLRKISTYFGLLVVLLLVFGSVEAKKSDQDVAKNLAAEFTVSNKGYHPDVAELKDGGFVVTWRAGAPNAVKAQLYNSKGNKVGAEIVVISESQEFQHPAVAALTTGGFVVAFEYDDGSGLGVFVQPYKATGEPDGARIKANIYSHNNQFYPAVAGLKNGRFVVVWSSRDQDGAHSAIVGRLFSRTGDSERTEFRVDTSYPMSSHEQPAVGALSDGGFVVAWNTNSSSGAEPPASSIRAQKFTDTGARDGKELTVPDSESTGQLYPDVAGLAKTRFVITGQNLRKSGNDGPSGVYAQEYNEKGVYAQEYNEKGRNTGETIVVDEKAADHQANQKIVGLNDGTFAIVWEADGAIRGQLYSSRAKKIGEIFNISDTEVPVGANPAIAAHEEKGFVAVWWSGKGINGSLYAPSRKREESDAIADSDTRDSDRGGVVEVQAVSSASGPNRIALENELPGTPRTVWGVDDDGDDNIQGFATDISVNVGDTVDFKIDTNSTNYRVDIYRIGYYDGDGARLVDSFEKQLAQPQVQPDPIIDEERGLVDAGNWSVSASWTVPTDAVSGIYFARLERQDATPGENMIPFVVRDDASQSDIVFQTSDTTWQAYNAWGGASLYENHLPDGVDYHAYAVSYNRPFKIITAVYGGPWDFIFTSEYAAIRWLERNGYDVSYISGLDVARSGNLLLDHKAFLSVGHDEYWSAEQRANVEAARDAGVNLAFWSGNTTYWKTRWEPSIDGSATDFRTMVTYKVSRHGSDIDPSPIATGTWRDPRFRDEGQLPENSLLGTMFTVDSYRTDTLSIPYEQSQFRFWENTTVATLQPGETATLLPPLLGYEWDSDVDNGNRPAGLVNLSASTHSVDSYLRDYGLYTGDNPEVEHSLTMYRAPSGALVFSAATVYWAFGLDTEHDANQMPADPDIRQAMVNMFADMGAQPTTLDPGLVAAVASIDQQAPTSTIATPTGGSAFVEGEHVTITGTAEDAGGGLITNVEVSVDDGQTWFKATGRETWSYSWAVQAAGTYMIRSRAVDDSYNVETAAAGTQVTVGLPETSSLWTLSAKPDEEAVTDLNAVSVGVRFQATTSGTVSAIRFYKGPLNIGSHTVHLWTAGGTLLASGTSTGEPYFGWQSVALDTPVPISANAVYVASYSTGGFYSATSQYFGSQYTSGLLSVPENGSVYAYGPPGTFPQFSYQGENYWVDVVFAADEVPQNDPPVAVNDSGFNAEQDVPLTLATTALLANDSDPNNDPLTVISVSAPTNGTVTLNSGANTVTFTPIAGYSGDASFNYTIFDGNGGTASATVSLTVAPFVNLPPVANDDDGFTTPVDTPMPLPASLLLANDTDGNGDALTVESVGNPVNGTVTYDSVAEIVTFTPSGGYTGPSSFSYDISDGLGGTDSATVSLTVTPPGVGVSLFTLADTPAILSVNDPNAVELGVKFTATAPGTATAIRYYKSAQDVGTHVGSLWSANGTLLGQVTFTGESASGWQQATLPTPVTIFGGNSYVVSFHSNGNYAATSNYFTAEHTSGPLTAPSSASSGGNGVYSYGAGGFPSQTYNASNYWVDVVFNQSQENLPPVAFGDYGYTTPQDTPLALATSGLLLNDEDPEGDTLTVTEVSAPTNGTVSLDSGTVTFTPTPGYSGAANFVYDISDGNGGTASAQVSLTVVPQGVSLASVFSPTDTPDFANVNDPSSVNLGMRFRSDASGSITAIRFYKGSSNTGTHTGYLWTSTGALLGSVTFNGETESGWQEATLAAPVAIAAGTEYIVSYHTNGYYSATGNFFANDVTNDGLTAPASIAGSGNGLYAYGAAGLFPSSTYSKANYYVDVVFQSQ